MQGSNESNLPEITVKLKSNSQGVRATFRQKNMPEMKNNKSGDKEKDGGRGPRGGMLQRIIERIPNSGVQYK